MNIISVLESIVKIRMELDQMKDKMEHLSRELDVQTSNMIEFLKDQRIIEARTV
jgi:hypothetical protein